MVMEGIVRDNLEAPATISKVNCVDYSCGSKQLQGSVHCSQPYISFAFFNLAVKIFRAQVFIRLCS
ncbi:MAG: hypothetical protein PWP58_381 [Bacillota bacterium]|nr:hypothetical protein [Bacillota bacterium]